MSSNPVDPQRKQALIGKFTLTLSHVATLFTLKNPDFDCDLVPDAKWDPDAPFELEVSLWSGYDVHKKKLVVKKPSFPWHYDLSLEANIAILTRFHRWKENSVPQLCEVQWIALNLVDFNRVNSWDFFNQCRESLLLWASVVGDIVILKSSAAKVHFYICISCIQLFIKVFLKTFQNARLYHKKIVSRAQKALRDLHPAKDTGRWKREIAYAGIPNSGIPHLNWVNRFVPEEPWVIDSNLIKIGHRMIVPRHAPRYVTSYVRENPPYADSSHFVYPYNRPDPTAEPDSQSPKGYVIESESNEEESEEEKELESVPVTRSVLLSGNVTRGGLSSFDDVASDCTHELRMADDYSDFDSQVDENEMFNSNQNNLQKK